MHVSTKKWLFTKISSFVLIPFMIWFILNFISVYENDYQTLVLFFTQQPTKILFSIFIVIAFFFSALTISNFFQSFFGKFLAVGLCWSFSFHILNELRHLFWDLGYGFDLKISKITGVLALVGSFVLTVLFYLIGKNIF